MTTISLARVRSVSLAIPEINWRKFLILGIFGFIFLTFLFLCSYIYFINNLTFGSYSINKYEKDINNLLKENAILESEFAQIGFLAGVQEKAEILSFEKIKEIKYIQVKEGVLASVK